MGNRREEVVPANMGNMIRNDKVNFRQREQGFDYNRTLTSHYNII